MSVFGMGMNDIMETFGLDKKVTLEAKSSENGVVAAGKASEIKGGLADLAGQGANTVKSAKVTLGVKNGITGAAENLEFNLEFNGLAANAAKGVLGTELAKALNENADFSNSFTASADGAGNLTIKSKTEGGDYTFTNVTLGNITDNTGGNVTGGTYTKNNTVDGDYGTISKNIQDGETVTIAGKTFTKVAAGKASTDREFEDLAGLEALLKADGIITEVKNK